MMENTGRSVGDLKQGVSLISYATTSPERSIEQADAARLVQYLGLTERWNNAVPALYRKSGVSRRGSVLLESDASEPQNRQSFYPKKSECKPLGPTTAERMVAYGKYSGPILLRACIQALENSGLRASDITHLVTVSCTGFQAPGVDHELFLQLGLSATTQRTHIGFMGCHGMLNGLRVAASYAESNPQAVVLVGAVELCTLHQQYSEDPEQIVANALFADGSACAILAGGEVASRVNKGLSWKVASSFSVQVADSRELMSWRIGDHGFEMSLSSQVPQRIAGELRAPLETWLSRSGLSIEQIDDWIVHPGGPRILDSVTTALQLPTEALDASRYVLANHGNMSSPTVMFILQESEKRNSLYSEPRNCVLLGFGPGLHAEAILLTKSQHTF